MEGWEWGAPREAGEWRRHWWRAAALETGGGSGQQGSGLGASLKRGQSIGVLGFGDVGLRGRHHCELRARWPWRQRAAFLGDGEGVDVTPRPTESTGEFENLSDEAEELCYSSLFQIYVTPIWS